MFIGHIGVGLAAKMVSPRTSLAFLLVAAQALDIICGVFMVTGIEWMRVHPGITQMTPLEFVFCPWSHGLFMGVVWAIAAAAIALRLLDDRRAAVVVGALVFSHWVRCSSISISAEPVHF